MSKSTSRRVFLTKTALVASGLTLLPSTTLLRSANLPKCPFDGYLPESNWNNDLREFESNVPSVCISGTVFDSFGLMPKPNTVMELWHLSPNSKKYSHRGKTITNEAGEYTFITDFPFREEGKSARLFFKIGSSDSGYFTELIVNDFGGHITGDHWERNQVLQSKIYPKLDIDGSTFNVTFHLTV